MLQPHGQRAVNAPGRAGAVFYDSSMAHGRTGWRCPCWLLVCPLGRRGGAAGERAPEKRINEAAERGDGVYAHQPLLILQLGARAKVFEVLKRPCHSSNSDTGSRPLANLSALSWGLPGRGVEAGATAHYVSGLYPCWVAP